MRWAWALAPLVAAGAAAADPAKADRSCVDVKIGDEQFYDCLNRDLAASSGGHRSSATDAPGLNQSGPALGVFNQAAQRQRLGDAFGKSLIPQRPAREFAPPPLVGPH